MEQRKLEITYSVQSLLKYSAFAAVPIGLLYTILSALAADGGTAEMAQFFLGLLLTLLSWGLLYGLSNAISLIRETKRSHLERTGQSQSNKDVMFHS